MLYQFFNVLNSYKHPPLPLIWRKRIVELRVLMSGDIFAVGRVRLSLQCEKKYKAAVEQLES